MGKLQVSWERLSAVAYDPTVPATIDVGTECVEDILEILLRFFATEAKR
jgi:hypothetical protein